MQVTADEIQAAGGKALAVRANVAEEAEVEAFVQQCVDHYGRIDGIYANAGVSGGGKSVTELTVADWQRTLGVNTVGVFLCGQTQPETLSGSRLWRNCVHGVRRSLASQRGRRRLFGQQGRSGEHRTNYRLPDVRERGSHQRHLPWPHRNWHDQADLRPRQRTRHRG